MKGDIYSFVLSTEPYSVLRFWLWNCGNYYQYFISNGTTFCQAPAQLKFNFGWGQPKFWLFHTTSHSTLLSFCNILKYLIFFIYFKSYLSTQARYVWRSNQGCIFFKFVHFLFQLGPTKVHFPPYFLFLHASCCLKLAHHAKKAKTKPKNSYLMPKIAQKTSKFPVFHLIRVDFLP